MFIAIYVDAPVIEANEKLLGELAELKVSYNSFNCVRYLGYGRFGAIQLTQEMYEEISGESEETPAVVVKKFEGKKNAFQNNTSYWQQLYWWYIYKRNIMLNMLKVGSKRRFQNIGKITQIRMEKQKDNTNGNTRKLVIGLQKRQDGNTYTHPKSRKTVKSVNVQIKLDLISIWNNFNSLLTVQEIWTGIMYRFGGIIQNVKFYSTD